MAFLRPLATREGKGESGPVTWAQKDGLVVMRERLFGSSDGWGHLSACHGVRACRGTLGARAGLGVWLPVRKYPWKVGFCCLEEMLCLETHSSTNDFFESDKMSG